MATANSNYRIVSLTGGTNGPYGTTTTPIVHEVYCLTSGSVSVTAIGGGSLTVSLTAGQSLNVLCSGIVVNSGTFCGFSPNNMGALNVIKSF